MNNFDLGHPFKNAFVSLLSTGLDSPIATYLMLKKGYNTYTLSFLNGGEKSVQNKNKILKIGEHLKKLTNASIRMHFVNYDPFLSDFILNCERKITCILCKRTMISMAAYLAKIYQAEFIVNGDILGEQASQTLSNLEVVNEINSNIPVIRPLVGFDKSEIIKINQTYGFYSLSLIKSPSCTNNPQYPETNAKLSNIKYNEQNIDRDSLLKKMMNVLMYVDL